MYNLKTERLIKWLTSGNGYYGELLVRFASSVFSIDKFVIRPDSSFYFIYHSVALSIFFILVGVYWNRISNVGTSRVSTPSLSYNVNTPNTILFSP